MNAAFRKVVLGFALSLALTSISPSAWAQTCVVRNDTPSQKIGQNGGVGSCLSVDQYARLLAVATISDGSNTLDIIPVSNATGLTGVAAGNVGWHDAGGFTTTSLGTTTTINSTGIGSAAFVGDAVFFRSGTGVSRVWSIVTAVATNSLTVSPAFPVAVPNGANGRILRPVPIAASDGANSSAPALEVDINSSYAGSGTTKILKLEDVAAVTGDALVAVAGVVNTNGLALAGEGDYTTPALNLFGSAYVDIRRQMQTGDGSSILKAEDALAASGDAGVFALAVRNDSWSSLADTNGDYTGIAVSSAGTVHTLVGMSGQASQADGLLKAEDALAVSGDAGVAAFAVANANLNALAGDGDYILPATTTAGVQFVNVVYNGTPSDGNNLLKAEDFALSNGNAAVVHMGQVQDPLTADTSASGDAGFQKLDLTGRTITTPYAPAGESWSACSDAETGTNDNEIKALVASNRIYVTSMSCYNNDTQATEFAIKSNTSVIYGGAIGNTTVDGMGHWEHTFGVPLRTASGAALNYAPLTTGSSLVCCAAGFISVN